MVKLFDHSSALRLYAKTIEAHGVKALEDVAIFAVLWRAAMLLDETLYLLEAGDYSLFASCPA
ncbi:hypothetical protein M2212_003108 [Bradyrhizobium elkanii]|uniref:hypothetical protein n=1 Tax=Bradyrhizobium elkanii TaxID=29448 RepID=UPI0030BA15A3|nr:hypothetical protein [Bradyrhizobium elkanii]MCS3686667.1 hypothetical protein [Bradyrhizobium elkanii]